MPRWCGAHSHWRAQTNSRPTARSVSRAPGCRAARRSVAVARAFYRRLRGRAGVIALDEPSAALDPDTEAQLWRSVRALADEGATVLLVSHRTSARAIADAVVRLEPAGVVV